MADLTDQLAQAGSLLSIAGVPATAQPGQLISTSLVPPLSLIHFTDIVQQDVSLDFIAKDVVFSNTNFNSPSFVEDPSIAKILPLFTLTSVPPTVDTSGTPGLIGKLKGTFPVAVPSDIAPTIAVVWKIQDEANNNLVDGSDFLAPNGLTNPTLDIVFLPAFAPFDGSAPPPAKRKIIASVTLTAGTATFSRDVGPVVVTIPSIPFPKVLALTRDTNFRGPALIMVPGASAITTVEHIRALLQPVRNVISVLTTVARFAEMLLGVDTLASILDATNIAFSKADGVSNLNDIDLESGFFNDTEAEDELSAFVYLAPPPPVESTENAVEMFNDRRFRTGEGKFTVTTGISFVALCNNLHSAIPTVTPTSATLTVNNPPSGGIFGPDSFGDELSSIRFL
jgi:hypothetical protein